MKRMLLIAVLAVSPTMARADVLVAPESADVAGLSAHGGVVAWTAGGLEGATVRVLRPDDTVRTVARGAEVAGPVDVGTDARGRAVVTWTVCRDGGVCVPWTVTAVGGRPQRLDVPAGRGCEIRAAARDGATVAFYRERRFGRRGRACRAGLYVRRGDGRARRVATSRGTYASSVDVEGHYAMVATSVLHDGNPQRFVSEILVVTTSGRRRLDRVATQVDTEEGRDGPLVTGAVLDGGSAYFKTRRDDAEASSISYSLDRLPLAGTSGEEQGDAQMVEGAFDVDAGRLFYATDGGISVADAMPPLSPRG